MISEIQLDIRMIFAIKLIRKGYKEKKIKMKVQLEKKRRRAMFHNP